MSTTRKLNSMLCLSLLTLIAGCPGEDEPPADTAGPAPEATEVAPRATTAEVPAEGPVQPCSPSNATGPYREASMRITLNSDGSIHQIEGTNSAGVWESGRNELSTEPESLGACVASIEVFALNDSTKELSNPDGTPTHAHVGQHTPPYNTHCHRWVRKNNVNTLVHC